MYILGLNAYHADSAACLLKGGILVAAAEEERFNRVKHWAGFPAKSIKYCLDEASISIGDIDHVAINTNPSANILKKIVYTLKNSPDYKLILDRINNKRKRLKIVDELGSISAADKFKGKIHYIEHHLSHIASAHIVSPFDESIALSVDGFGDFSSLAWGACCGHNIDIKQRVYFPHSLGIFYQAMTQFLGFHNYGDEYKVMGLAPYGKPTYLNHMNQVVRELADGTFELNLEYFCHHNSKVKYQWSGGSPIVGNLFNSISMENLFGVKARKSNQALTQCHYDLAYSIQARYEEIFFNLLKHIYSHHKCTNLTLAGGCAMNSVANGKITLRSPYKKVYIQSAAGDAGGAIGAAFIAGDKIGDLKKRFYMDHPYTGPSFNNHYHERLLSEKKSVLLEEGCVVEFIKGDEKLCERTAVAISEGLIIGWFQGRMEWGPRALGNRSILCDPRRSDMKQILNNKIKRRESFRPFAPSILREKVSAWFQEEADVPFMMQVFQVRNGKRISIPAVTHIDGSGRLQTVHRETNPLYYRLIEHFDVITGVPILLNTSFNENEPVVCRPEEALNTFLRTKMDMLVIGNWVVRRKD